jgi:hypothetical protein
MFISETFIQVLSRGLLEPGEQLVARSLGVETPWWSMGIPFLHTTYLVLSTDRRLILVEHSRDFFGRGHKMERVHSIPWSQVREAKVKGLLRKKLRVMGQSDVRNLALTLKLPGGLFPPVAGNVQGARAIEGQGKALLQLAAPPMQPQYSLPPPSMQPQASPVSGYPQPAQPQVSAYGTTQLSPVYPSPLPPPPAPPGAYPMPLSAFPHAPHMTQPAPQPWGTPNPYAGPN